MSTFKYQCSAVEAAACTSGTWVPDDAGLLGVALSTADAEAIFSQALLLFAVAWIFRTLAKQLEDFK